jgi:phage-related protein
MPKTVAIGRRPFRMACESGLRCEAATGVVYDDYFRRERYGSFDIDRLSTLPYVNSTIGATEMVELPTMKPCEFIGSAKGDISAMPQDVKDIFGFAIRTAQRGAKHPDAKVLKGFGSAGVLEVIENFEGDTYRAVYTVKFAGVVYVLHVFKKKSKKGAETPKPDMKLIETRLKDAEKKYNARNKTQKSA